MKIVIAPDSYKECLSAIQVAETLAGTVTDMYPGAEVVQLPLSDGGEGLLDILSKALKAQVVQTDVHDPLGRPVKARLGLINRTAIIEVAEACGLQRLSTRERNPLQASSRGVGELILAAYQMGGRSFFLGLGGTATCDGGKGMLSVAGIKDVLKSISIELLCDVDAPFVGPRGAARVFAPQKGATPEEVEVLEKRMTELARSIGKETGVHIADQPGAGAAGGLGGALMAYSSARFRNGVGRVMDLTGYDEAIKGAHLIITGEGKSDAQTLMGKVPMGVLQRAKGLPVALLSGRIENRSQLEQAGFRPVIEVSPRDLPLSEALKPESAMENLRQAILSPFFTQYVAGEA